MKNSLKRALILAAAVGAVSVSTAMAQYRIDTGHVNDANPRAGSGGINEDSRVGRGGYNGVTGNDIVTGNVTAGKQFRGNVGYTDSRAFRGNISRPSDSFTRGSSGSPYAGSSANNATIVQPYYGDKQAAPPPPGFVRSGIGNPGYSPAPDPTRIGSDLRLGQVLDRPNIALPAPGQTIMPGPVDASNNETLISASSLYGVRQWSPNNLADQAFMTRYGNGMFGENGMRSSLTDLEIGAMRREMNQMAGESLSPAALKNAIGGDNDSTSPANNPDSLNKPMEAPGNGALNNGALQATALTSKALGAGLETGEGMQARMLVPAAKQSAANEMLQKRLEEQGGQKPETDVDRAREFNKQLKAAQEKEKAGGVGARPVPGAQPGAPGAVPGAFPGTPAAAPGAAPEAQPSPMPAVPGPTGGTGAKASPPQIKSFAEGVKAKGLGDILKKAEDFMKDGKWYSAIEQYDTAQQVSPNNMLILVGRANAELGGSYYKPAEAHLRTAFLQDPAMLEGQYDLRTMIGEDRLRFLVKDLQETATKNPNQSMPLFLLSYISYNSGNEKMAAGYLDLAEKRAQANDTFYTLVRKHWVLPAKGEAPVPELNK